MANTSQPGTDGRAALVTGAGSGFGARIALALTRAGYAVFAGVRDAHGRGRARADALRAEAGDAASKLRVLDLDVTDDASAEAAVGQALAQAGRVDVLVNNAGIMFGGVTEGYTVAQARKQIETNFLGAVRMDRLVLPAMRAQGDGLLVHVTSLAGSMVFPFYGLYCASKMATEALAESYRYELAPLGVDSVVVQPGPFATNLLASQEEPAEAGRVAAYGEVAAIPARMHDDTKALIDGPEAQDPQVVADLVVRLAGLPFGARPLRSVAGAIDFGARDVNAARAVAQRELLRAWGLDERLGQRGREPAGT